MFKLLILFFYGWALVGCSYSPYRNQYESLCDYRSGSDCAKSVNHKSKNKDNYEYRLSFIEYDDQGYLYSPSAKRSVMESYRKIAEKDDVLLITYVHGWFHNANGDPQDDNIEEFRKILGVAAKREVLKCSALPPSPFCKSRKVLGIYIGWDGRSLPSFLNYFSFWGRKAAAHEVGEGLTEVLLELEHIVKGELRQHPHNRMVTIGHSFGGAAVFSALRPILAERYISSRPYKTELRADGFGDLVVLLNPAFEALRYGPLFDLSQDECREYPPNQLPKLVILSSSADWAMRDTFRLGRFPNTLLESHRTVQVAQCGVDSVFKLSQWRADIMGVGHANVYVTHKLNLNEDSVSLVNDSVSDPSSAWFSQIKSAGGDVSFGGMTLQSKKITKPLNPYLNIFTSGQIMSSHGDIWNSKIAFFINDMISISTSD